MEYVHFVLGLVMVLALALLANRRNWKLIKPRYIGQLLVVELALAWFMLNSEVGLAVVGGFAAGFTKLMEFAKQGTDFVFGGLVNEGAFSFFLMVLMPIVFISVLIGILQYIRLLPLVIRGIGTVLAKINGMGKLESFNAISSMIVGQSENFIALKNILPHLNEKQMYTLAATAMSTVSMSIVGAYMQLIEPRYVVAALVLNMFSTFVVLSLINPYEPDNTVTDAKALSEGDEHHTPKKENFFEMLGEYIMAGFTVAVIVGAMLVGFIALIALINYLFEMAFGVNFQHVMGYIFYPIAWILGIPGSEALQGRFHHGDQAGDQRIRGHDGSGQDRGPALSAYRRHPLHLHGVVRQLQLHRHHRRCGEGAERREGQHGLPLRSEAGVRLHPCEPALRRDRRCDAVSHPAALTTTNPCLGRGLFFGGRPPSRASGPSNRRPAG